MVASGRGFAAPTGCASGKIFGPLTRAIAGDYSCRDGALHNTHRAARMDTRLLNDLKKLLGADMVLHRPEELLLYEYDGSVETARPSCVVFPQNKSHVVGIVELANRYQVPIVGRGAGTGLSGGA